MRALRIETHGQPLVAADIAIPSPAADEVVIRVRAAGICHTDANLRRGGSSSATLPLIPGHEIAGEITAVGAAVRSRRIGDRVCVHYVVSCTHCVHCIAGREQFCTTGQMIGAQRPGGYAEYVAVPARNAVPLPESISYLHGAVMMCSSATSLHALHRGRIAVGDTVAVLGVGGLGISAVQLARELGASRVFAIDRDEAKLTVAASLGATSVSASDADAVEQVRALTGGMGVTIALDLVGAPEVTLQALQMLAVHGRAVAVGIHPKAMELPVYRTVLGPEVELVGANDHLLSELHELIAMAQRGALDLGPVDVRSIPLDADPVNAVLDALDNYQAPFRTAIVMA
jgi:2-desacetyl-2-hydroxyethyl bacteriochlorophyllide A dehydrogenase